eukprot:SAG11_NODE_5273_length_1609_cov_1.665563_1_plen_49_part_00
MPYCMANQHKFMAGFAGDVAHEELSSADSDEAFDAQGEYYLQVYDALL